MNLQNCLKRSKSKDKFFIWRGWLVSSHPQNKRIKIKMRIYACCLHFRCWAVIYARGPTLFSLLLLTTFQDVICSLSLHTLCAPITASSCFLWTCTEYLEWKSPTLCLNLHFRPRQDKFLSSIMDIFFLEMKLTTQVTIIIPTWLASQVPSETSKF